MHATRSKIGLIVLVFMFLALPKAYAQRIPQAIEYTEIYDFLEELTTDGIIRSNAAIKPYTRDYIARLLVEAQSKDSLLNKRQRDDLQFYLQDYALECDTLPVYYSYGHRHVTQWITPVSNLSLADPSLHILTKDKVFKMRVRPILGMDLYANKNGLLQHRWFGVDIQMDIAKHLSKDVKHEGKRFRIDVSCAARQACVLVLTAISGKKPAEHTCRLFLVQIHRQGSRNGDLYLCRYRTPNVLLSFQRQV